MTVPSWVRPTTRCRAAALLTCLATVSAGTAAWSGPAPEPWRPAQLIRAAGPDDAVTPAAARVLDDGSTVALFVNDGAFWQSRRDPGAEWTEPQRMELPEGNVLLLGSSAISPKGTIWLTYSIGTQGGDEAHLVRMSGDQPETLLEVSANETAGSVTTDAEGDVLFTVRSSSRNAAWYGDEDSTTLTRLAPRSRLFSFQPHSWALGPGDRVGRAAFNYDDQQIEVRRVTPGAARAPIVRRWSAPTQGIDHLYAEVRLVWRDGGGQVVTWTEPDGRPTHPDLTRLARRDPGGAWLGARVVGRSKPDSYDPISLLRTSLTERGAYVAWVQPGRRTYEKRIVGYFVRPGRPPERQLVAAPSHFGAGFSVSDFTVATDDTGRLLVVWDTSGQQGAPPTQIAEGRVRGELSRQELFTDASSLGLLRPGGEATVIARVNPPDDPSAEQLVSRSTD